MNPEIVAHDPKNNFSSGGGFSNYFPRPSYQDTVVTAYIDKLDAQFEGLFNTSGRGYPDIAAQGFHFLTIWNGTIVTLDGTRYVGVLGPFLKPSPDKSLQVRQLQQQLRS